MYERFTDNARSAMKFANQEAQRFNHEYVGTEHILLGLIKVVNCTAVQVWQTFDLSAEKIRVEIEVRLKKGEEDSTMGKLPQTPRAKKVIEYAMDEARNFGHNYVGTEHLLLGLLREQEGVAALSLINLGLKIEDVRDEVLRLLGQMPENMVKKVTFSGTETGDCIKALHDWLIKNHGKFREIIGPVTFSYRGSNSVTIFYEEITD